VSHQRRFDPPPPTGIAARSATRRTPRRMMLHDGAWYFDTRERLSVGPYRSRSEAVAASDVLTELIRHANPVRARALIKDFVRSTRYSIPMPH